MSWFMDFLTDVSRQAAPGIQRGMEDAERRKRDLESLRGQIPIQVEQQKALEPLQQEAENRKFQRDIFLQYLKSQSKTGPGQRPMTVSPGATVYDPEKGPVYTAPAAQPPTVTPAGREGLEPAEKGYRWMPSVGESGKKSWRQVKEDTAPGGATVPGLEFLATQQALPHDLTNVEDRADYATSAAKAGLVTPAQVLQHTRTPIERVPLRLEDRGPYEAFNRAIKEGKSESEATEIAERVRNRIRESGATASAAGGEIGKQRSDVPLRIRDLLLFGKPVGTTYGQLQGEEPATPQMREEVTQLDNAGAILDTLKGLSDRLITAKSPVEAVTQAATLHVGALTKKNETAASYQDTKQMFLGVLSRTLGGERGVLTDRDIARVVKGLPDFRDTTGVKDFKLGALRAILDVATDAKMRVITASPPDPKFRQKLEQMLVNLYQGQSQVPQQSSRQPAPSGGWSIKPKGR